VRGISKRQVGRIVATFTGEPVSPQTVSLLTRDLDEAVKKFRQARLVWRENQRNPATAGFRAQLRRKSGGREGMLWDLNNRGLEGRDLRLNVTGGCPGLAAAIPVTYPRARHPLCSSTQA
jgi:transposase-like protein